jgi:hypothetical protein
MGDPASELIKIAGEEKVGLIAISTHGHGFSELIHGTTVDRCATPFASPVLLLRGKRGRITGPAPTRITSPAATRHLAFIPVHEQAQT